MKIITKTQVTAVPNDVEGEPRLVPEVRHEANIQTDEEGARILELKGMKDHRVLNARVFELHISEDGVPTVGSEML